MATLNLFPARVRFTNADGTLTPEAYRTLQVLSQRAGGPLGDNGRDVFGDLTGVAALDLSIMDTVTQQPATEQALADVVQPPNEAVPFDLAAAIHTATSKATPVDADELPLADSASAFKLKKLTWLNLKSTILAYLSNVAFAIGVTTPSTGKFTSLTTTLPSVFSGTLKVGATTYNPYGVAFTGGYNVGWTNAADAGVGAYFAHNTSTNDVVLVGGVFSASNIKVNAGGFIASDSSVGINANVTSGNLPGKTMIFKDGILISFI